MKMPAAPAAEMPSCRLLLAALSELEAAAEPLAVEEEPVALN